MPTTNALSNHRSHNAPHYNLAQPPPPPPIQSQVSQSMQAIHQHQHNQTQQPSAIQYYPQNSYYSNGILIVTHRIA
jgi:hypothetical protein